MEKNKIIIVALIVVIAALLLGIVAVMPNMNKQDTYLVFKSNDEITEGDFLKFELDDSNGTPLANQTVNITFSDGDDSSSYYSAVTNAKGIGKLTIDKGAGDYLVTISYGGDDKFNGCSSTRNITVLEKVAEAQVESSSSPQASNTHIVIAEDGYYALVDDDGNILEDLGPSKKYYPDNPNSVYYPDAEPMGNYIDMSL